MGLVLLFGTADDLRGFRPSCHLYCYEVELYPSHNSCPRLKYAALKAIALLSALTFSNIS